MTPPYAQNFIAYGVAVTVVAQDKRIQKAVRAFLENLAYFEISPKPDQGVRFDLYLPEDFPQKPVIPPSAEEISLPEYEVKIYKTADEFFILFEGSWLRISLQDRHAIGVFDDSIWAYPRGFTHGFFLSGLFILLHRFGLHAIHGAGLIHREKGFLIVGKSGSGKSTLALALLRQGWKYLGDDVLLLHQIDSRIEALAVPNEFKVDDRVFRSFCFENNGDLAFKIPYNDKWFLKIDRLYPEQFEMRCIPKFIIYPEITESPQSQLVPLRKSEALKRAIDASQLLQHDSTQISQHLETLAKLVNQTTVYQLYAGRDVLENPEAFEKFLLDNTYRMEK